MNNTKSTILLLLLFSVFNISFSQIGAVTAKSNTYYVPDDFSTIQEAVDTASDGDTVFVKSGTYTESISVSCSISVIGEDHKTT
ncbi:MAG: hypothetical protein IAX21_10940 [Candidatus Bathyarchaeota archaeon]|nr:hypothetical protein [Candidatus Bathyarchaeum tardum]WGM88616.1 MAG: hypothetical protein NUK63_06745 [Candidatus Bathyarchaeum tardum]WNZ29128.1 MAG: hypothetical protein IAX21_10940 [Candidatus Bathyarchaeota archaeon]